MTGHNVGCDPDSMESVLVCWSQGHFGSQRIQLGPDELVVLRQMAFAADIAGGRNTGMYFTFAGAASHFRSGKFAVSRAIANLWRLGLIDELYPDDVAPCFELHFDLLTENRPPRRRRREEVPPYSSTPFQPVRHRRMIGDHK